MHIPASMLHGSICPVTLGVGAVGVALSAWVATKSKEAVSAAKFAAVTALVFALQMLNFPVANGTSGHLLGALLAVSLLRVPLAVLSISLVLTVQALFFGDGGLNALGANIINMAFIGAGVGGLIQNFLLKRNIGKSIALSMSCWVSVMLAATACSFEVALSGTVALAKVIPAMLSVHALIGIGEILITASVLSMLNVYAKAWQKNENAFALGGFVLASLAAFISPLASKFPDGLEYVAGKLSFTEFNALNFHAVFPDYQILFLGNGAASTIAAALMGVVLTAFSAYFVGKALRVASRIYMIK